MGEPVIRYSLPDFYNYYNLNLLLLDTMIKYPGWFRSNVLIDSMYGTFPGCIWNGGRVQHGQAPYENILNTIRGLNMNGISVRLTFTNLMLDESHFGDTYGNTILEIANELSLTCEVPGNVAFRPLGKVQNGVNVSNPDFLKYIEDKYPKLYTMHSTTKGLKSAEEVNELSEDGHLVVIPYQMNNTDIIDKFSRPNRLELLCCETCIDNCPNRQHHYRELSKAQLMQPSQNFRCSHGCESYYYYDTVPERHHHITPEMIETHYIPRGINKFKISGRNDNVINVVERYVEYLANPEYRDTVRNHLLIDQLFPNPELNSFFAAPQSR